MTKRQGMDVRTNKDMGRGKESVSGHGGQDSLCSQQHTTPQCR